MAADDDVKRPVGAGGASGPEGCPDPERLAAWIDGASDEGGDGRGNRRGRRRDPTATLEVRRRRR